MTDRKCQNIVILGSTGSIGVSTLDVVQNLSPQFQVTGLAACSNWEKLADQAQATGCRKLVTSNRESAEKLRRSGIRAEIGDGESALCELVAREDVDVVVCAITGAASLMPVLTAIRAGKKVALASKEALVMAGELVMCEARRHGATILPIDSEHSAILQCLQGIRRDEIERFILTASGGPFRGCRADELENASPARALAHPTWNMGAKITIDSATLMNKALELIEAKWLFDANADNIDVVVHPQSIIHSMIELRDAGILAQMGVPDMRLPIQFALTYPHHEKLPILQRLDLTRCGTLTFEPPDEKTFPALRLARAAVANGGTMPAVLNAANEKAVELFLQEQIGFLDIARKVEAAMAEHSNVTTPDLNEILAADARARRMVN